MKIIHAYPPMIDEIDAAFSVRGKAGVIFAWGGTVYVPDGGQLSPALRAHEALHGERQEAIGGPEPWWRRYISDPEFRLAEEIPAHRAEYRAYCLRHPNRRKQHAYLDVVAARLASPLYGGLLTFGQARAEITR